MRHQAGALTPTTREVFTNFRVRILCWCSQEGLDPQQNITIQQTAHGGSVFFHFYMMAQHIHLVSSQSNKSIGTEKKIKMSTVTKSWLWFQLLLIHLAEFAEAALVFNVTYIRKAGFSSLPVTVDVSTSTLTHVRPPVMSSLHSPGITSTRTLVCIWSFFPSHCFFHWLKNTN